MNQINMVQFAPSARCTNKGMTKGVQLNQKNCVSETQKLILVFTFVFEKFIRQK